jgi:hypothetical protein
MNRFLLNGFFIFTIFFGLSQEKYEKESRIWMAVNFYLSL